MKSEKIIVIGIVFALAMLAFVGCASAATIYVNPGESIQDAVDAASAGDTIIVYPGTYTENVKVNKRLTIQSENGADNTIVQAANPDDHIFEITADYVNISGFRITSAVIPSSAIYILHAEYCVISNNNLSNIIGWGINLISANNNFINNNTISDSFGCGICLNSSNNNMISNNNMNNNFGLQGMEPSWRYVFGLYSSLNNTISKNNISNNTNGIRLSNSQENNISNNIISNDGIGFSLDFSSENKISKNTLINDGLFVEESYQNAVEDNTINGKPLVYLEDESDRTITDAGQVILVNCNNITVKNLNLFNTVIGVELWKTNNSKIINNNISSNKWGGIYLYNSLSNVISKNSVLSNGAEGILLDYSSLNNISSNNVSSNYLSGIRLRNSTSNNVSNNNLSDNHPDGLLCGSVRLLYSNNNIISNNNIFNNLLGIGIEHSNNNNLNNNNISNNDCMGILSLNSSSSIYLNNFVNNNRNSIFLINSSGIVYLNNFMDFAYSAASWNSTTIWNSTSKLTYTYNGNTYTNYLGNYWLHYHGSDLNEDGIGDTPYYYMPDKDYYPLMERFENYIINETVNHHPNPPTNLVQFKSDSATIISVGGTIDERTVTFKGNVSDPDGDKVILQVELRRLDEYGGQFDETEGGLKDSVLVESGSEAVAYADGLIDADYHWQARAVDEHGAPSEWVDFGNNNISEADFIVKTVPIYKPELSIPFYAPYWQRAYPGTGLTYKIRVTNEGTKEDVIELSPVDSNVNIKFSDNPVTLLPGESRLIDVYLEVKAMFLIKNDITIRGRSQNSGDINDVIIYVGDIRSRDTDKYGLFSYYLVFRNNEEKQHTLTFDVIPATTKITDSSITLLAHTSRANCIDFNPKESSELDNSRVNIRIEDNQNSMEIPIKFGDYEIISSEFDMAIDAYKFSNNDLSEASCFGMAATSALYFNGKLPSPNNKKTTYSLEMEEALSNIEFYQNSLWINKWADFNPLGWDNKMKEDQYNKLKESIGRAGKGEPMLILLGGGQGGEKKHHCVAAYGIAESKSESYILIYDPNWPYRYEALETANAFPYITYNLDSKELSYRTYTKFKIIEAKKDPWYKRIKLLSSASLRVYDSQGRVTGIIKGERRQEIPFSVFDEENKTVLIFFPSDEYCYELLGTNTGNYGLEITSVEDGETTTFTATDIPTTAGATHQYTIDRDALSQGEEGVTVQVDSDGDGEFEDTFTADGELTYDEFMLQTATTIDFDPDTLNLQSKGKWVTVYTELPAGYNLTEINVSTMMLNKTVPAELQPTEIGDYDSDGIADLMVKFDRQAVIDILPIGDTVNIIVTGELTDGTPFEGSDVIRVIDEG